MKWEQPGFDDLFEGALGPATTPEHSSAHLREHVAPRPVWNDYTAQKRQHCGGCEQAGVPVRARRVRTVGKSKAYYCRACAEPIEAQDKAAGPVGRTATRPRREVA